MLQFRNWRRSRVVSIRNIWTALKKITSLSFQKWAKLKRDIEYRKKSKGKYIFSYILKKDGKIGAMNGANVKVHFKSQANFSWLFSHVLCWGRYFSKSIKFLFHFSHFFSLVCQPEKNFNCLSSTCQLVWQTDCLSITQPWLTSMGCLFSRAGWICSVCVFDGFWLNCSLICTSHWLLVQNLHKFDLLQTFFSIG